jgi:uncharacterized membrane protein (DUF441 family)
MLKFALAFGITVEWLVGPAVYTASALVHVVLQTLCATLLAWAALEGMRVLLAGALSLDDRPAAGRPRAF